jgi:uncharacterized spore protein YtfJ
MPDIDELLRGAQDAIAAKRVFGEPIERDGVTVIPTASVRGGAGGGGGRGSSPKQEEGEGEGAGGGYGFMAHPAGVFVIRGDQVDWRPALDLGKVILGGQLVAVTFLLVLRSILRRR